MKTYLPTNSINSNYKYTANDLYESLKNLDYVNDLAPEGVVFSECIVFDTEFRSPIFGGGAWNPNRIYEWSWYLGRTEGGNWQLLTWGVG